MKNYQGIDIVLAVLMMLSTIIIVGWIERSSIYCK